MTWLAWMYAVGIAALWTAGGIGIWHDARNWFDRRQHERQLDELWEDGETDLAYKVDRTAFCSCPYLPGLDEARPTPKGPHERRRNGEDPHPTERAEES